MNYLPMSCILKPPDWPARIEECNWQHPQALKRTQQSRRWSKLIKRIRGITMAASQITKWSGSVAREHGIAISGHGILGMVSDIRTGIRVSQTIMLLVLMRAIICTWTGIKDAMASGTIKVAMVFICWRTSARLRVHHNLRHHHPPLHPQCPHFHQRELSGTWRCSLCGSPVSAPYKASSQEVLNTST